QKQLGQQAMSLLDSDSVYWLRRPPTLPSSTPSSQRNTEVAPILYTQLVQTSALLKRLLLTDNACNIFSGTALSVDSSFSFSSGRFGLANDATPAFSVITEHHEQTLLY